ncbi:MAG: ABC transporter ATP-binding protein [Parachlamydiales bacterium]|nr:ABC transporter ATP-binding protein [Parachlamydiales bacterium]
MLDVVDLSVTFQTMGKKLYAVRGITFSVGKSESVGIVGESGCGKSAAVQAIAGLSSGEVTGKIAFQGENKQIGMVFQDPMTSLNPTMKIGDQIAEGMIYHKLAGRKEAKIKAIELLKLVGVTDPESRIHQYPHQFSGGMRQRVLIAIALACNPKLLIADEPTTALDVTIQAQILDLIKRMQKHFEMSLLLISHDFGVIASVCERVLVMYAGKIVESGTVDEVLNYPRHPYTQMLLNSIPRLDRPRGEPLKPIEGTPPNLLTLPKGCAFKERCPFAALKCEEEPVGPVACWRAL